MRFRVPDSVDIESGDRKQASGGCYKAEEFAAIHVVLPIVVARRAGEPRWLCCCVSPWYRPALQLGNPDPLLFRDDAIEAINQFAVGFEGLISGSPEITAGSGDAGAHRSVGPRSVLVPSGSPTSIPPCVAPSVTRRPPHWVSS